MKKLKNYVVKAKWVAFDSSSKYINYLLSTTTKSHSNTKIININETKKEDLISSIFDLKYKNEKKYILNAKGGKKLKNIFKSLTLNIPESYEVSEENLKKISSTFEKDFLDFLNAKNIQIDPKSLFNVAHLQTNSHFHFLIPTIDLKGNNIRLLVDKSFLLQIKVMFSNVVDKVLETKIENYEKKIVEHPNDPNKTMLESKKNFLEKRENNFLEKLGILETKLLEDLENKAIEEKEKQYLKTTIDLINRFNNNLIELEKVDNEKLEKISFQDIQKALENISNSYSKIEVRIEKLESYGKLNILQKEDILNKTILNKAINKIKQMEQRKNNIRGK